MKTKRLSYSDTDKVIELLNKDKVVAFPTDTVFGVGIRYDRDKAIKNLKRAKDRPESKPFPLMVGNKEQIRQVAYVSEKAKKLIDAFMPGAITLVFVKKENVSDEITNGFNTIAIRMPDDKWICSLISEIGVPLLVTSANISGGETTHNSDEVLEQLDERISGIVLGESGGLLSSTIVDVTSDEFRILREGPISREEIESVWNR